MNTPAQPGKRTMSIEALLRWAYQTELVNLDPREANPMFEEYIGGGGGGSGYEEGAIARMVHPDAKVVANVVSQLRGDEWAAGVAWPPITYSMADMSMADQPFIDVQIPRAETLVVCHARLGNQPDALDEPFPTADRADNGRPRVVRMAPVASKVLDGSEVTTDMEVIAAEERARVRDKAGIYPMGSYCLLKWYPEPNAIMRDRAQYVVWRAALIWLRDQLAGVLERHDVDDRLPVERPWMLGARG